MKKIGIIGGGIIGITLANYLDLEQYEVLLFDHQKNQATAASAGIISPWLSKRRNKEWYQLAKDGAAFFEQLVDDFGLSKEIYERCGTLFLRSSESLKKLEALAMERKKEAPEIGEIKLLTETETASQLPLLKPSPSLYISGGAKLDGRAYLTHMNELAKHRGVQMISKTAQIKRSQDGWEIQTKDGRFCIDILVLCPGPALKELLDSIGYVADVKPQKGQLLSFNLSLDTNHWPVAFLDGEADLIPFSNGRLLLGATHENEAGWDLDPTQEAFDQLTDGVKKFINDPSFIETKVEYRVGTRAYTSDFAPFFGPLQSNLAVACGLGSSGLTTGPYIAYLLAEYFNGSSKKWETSQYQKAMTNYVVKKEKL